MIWTDRQRTDATLRKLVHNDGTEENVHIEEATNNVVTNGTPVNEANLNVQEKNIGTYGADTYDDTATYEVGDIVTYESLLYRCIVVIETPESFNASHWQTVSLLQLSESNEQKAKILDTDVTTLNSEVDTLDINKVNKSAIKNEQSSSTEEIYSANYINNQLQPQIITAKLNSNYTLTTTNAYEKIPIETFHNLSSCFTMNSSHQIVIGSGVSHIEISASTIVECKGGTGNKYLRINKNTSGVSVQRNYQNTSNVTIPLNFSPFIIAVDEGDKIDLNLYGTANDIAWGLEAEYRTYITVRKVD